MNKKPILLLALLNISTHLMAMNNPFDANAKIDNPFDHDAKHKEKDFFTEYQTPIITGSAIGIGAAFSLYKWDRKYIIGACALSASFVLYKCMKDSELDKELNQSFKKLDQSCNELNQSCNELNQSFKEFSQSFNDLENSQKKAIKTSQDLLSIVKDRKRNSFENQETLLNQIVITSEKDNELLSSIYKETSDQHDSTVELNKNIAASLTTTTTDLEEQFVTVNQKMLESCHRTDDLIKKSRSLLASLK